MREFRQLTTDPVQVPPRVTVASFTPEFIRLPKPGQSCPYTGMGRSALNALILPTVENRGKPPVRSFVLRQRGARTGIRLIDYVSLVAHIRANEDMGVPAEPQSKPAASQAPPA